MAFIPVPPADGRGPAFSPRELPLSQALLQGGEAGQLLQILFPPSSATSTTFLLAPIINTPNFSFSLEFLLSSARCHSRCHWTQSVMPCLVNLKSPFSRGWWAFPLLHSLKPGGDGAGSIPPWKGKREGYRVVLHPFLACHPAYHILPLLSSLPSCLLSFIHSFSSSPSIPFYFLLFFFPFLEDLRYINHTF